MKNIADTLKLDGINAKGYGIIYKFVMTDTDLSPDAKAIYAYLCAHAGSGTTCYPSRSRILADLDIAKNTYYTHLKQLTTHGYINVQQGRFNSNSFIIVSAPDKLKAVALPKSTGNSPLLYQGGLKAHGYGTIPRIVMTDSRIERKAKALYAYFCSFAGAGSVTFPKASITMRQLGMGKAAYYKYLQQLISCNYITVAPRKLQGKFDGNDYLLNDCPDQQAGEQQAQQRRAAYLQRLNNRINKPSAPCPKNCDTGNSPRKRAFFTAAPCPSKADTSHCDTQNCDSNSNRFTINSLLNNISQSELTDAKERIRKEKGYNGQVQQSPLHELALDVLAAVELAADEQPIHLNKSQPPQLAATIKHRIAALRREQLDKAVESVQAIADTGNVRNPAAYLLAALCSWAGQSVSTTVSKPFQEAMNPSYDMDKIHWMMKYGKI